MNYYYFSQPTLSPKPLGVEFGEDGPRYRVTGYGNGKWSILSSAETIDTLYSFWPEAMDIIDIPEKNFEESMTRGLQLSDEHSRMDDVLTKFQIDHPGVLAFLDVLRKEQHRVKLSGSNDYSSIDAIIRNSLKRGIIDFLYVDTFRTHCDLIIRRLHGDGSFSFYTPYSNTLAINFQSHSPGYVKRSEQFAIFKVLKSNQYANSKGDVICTS